MNNDYSSNSNLSQIQIKMGGVMLRCPRNDCKHTWVSHSESKHFVSCPFCRRAVHTVRDRVNVNGDAEGVIKETYG